MDTIFAQATAPGRAGVSVVRISGPASFQIAQEIGAGARVDRGLGLRAICDKNSKVIDRALVLFFKGPHSFTGEDVVELHLHGSIAVVRAVLELLSSFPDARIAEPGEFTRRALENGKLDLTQVEGLADLIDAETEAQRVQAMRVLSGHLGQQVESWRAKLIRAAALLEATIDFADEDVPVDVTPEVRELLGGVHSEIKKAITGSHVAERIRTGFEIAIVGRPNVGKSTLLNALAGRDAAITSTVAGTTRDVIEVRMDIGGYPVTLLDTAGLRDSEDEVEKIGIERAIERASQADFRILLCESPDDVVIDAMPDDLILLSKADERKDGAGAVSGKTGQGVDQLLSDLEARLSKAVASTGLAAHERHRMALLVADRGLEASAEVLNHGPDSYELVAEEIRIATRALESLVGRIDVENLLDEIFSSFCLGK